MIDYIMVTVLKSQMSTDPSMIFSMILAPLFSYDVKTDIHGWGFQSPYSVYRV
jgi:hypothetical protein